MMKPRTFYGSQNQWMEKQAKDFRPQISQKYLRQKQTGKYFYPL